MTDEIQKMFDNRQLKEQEEIIKSEAYQKADDIQKIEYLLAAKLKNVLRE